MGETIVENIWGNEIKSNDLGKRFGGKGDTYTDGLARQMIRTKQLALK